MYPPLSRRFRRFIKSARKQRQSRCRPTVERLEDRTVPSLVSWDGGGDGVHTSDPLNWDTDALPTSADDVSISYAGISVIEDGSAAWNSLSSDADLEIDGSLSLAAASSIYGSATLNGGLDLLAGASLALQSGGTLAGSVQADDGAELLLAGGFFDMTDGASVAGLGRLRVAGTATLSVDANASVDNMTLEPDGTLDGIGTLTVTSTLDWTGGGMMGSGSTDIAQTAALNINGPNAMSLTDRTINNAGLTVWTAGDIHSDSATFNNELGATFDVQADLTWQDSATTTMNNDGTFQRTAGTGTVSLMPVWNNNGTMDVETGTVELDGGGTLSGTQTVAASAELYFADGNYDVNDGALFDGDGDVQVGDDQGGAGAPVFNVQAGGAQQGVTVRANYNLAPNGELGGAGTLRITRTLNVTGGTMSGTGTTQIAGGATANITSMTQDDRTLEIQSGAVVNWNGIAPGNPNWRMLNGAQIVNANGRFNINTNPNRVLEMDVGFNAQPTTLFQNNGEVVQAGTGDATIGVHNFNNDGVIQVNSGELKLSIERFFVNTGYLQAAAGATVYLQGGEYEFNPLLADTDQHMLRGDGWFVVDFVGELTVPQSALVIADNIELAEDGFLTGLGTFEVSYFKWTGGRMTTDATNLDVTGGTTMIPAGGRMEIVGDGTVTLRSRLIDVQGQLDWGLQANPEMAVDILMYRGAEISINGGTFDIWNGSVLRFVEDNTTPPEPQIEVKNNGTIRKDITEQQEESTITLQVFNRGGTIQIDGGLVLLLPSTNESGVTRVTSTGSLTLSSTQLIVNHGILEVQGLISCATQFNNGFVRVNGGLLNLSGQIEALPGATDAVSIADGGTLTGSGTITGRLTNSGEISFASPYAPATLTIDGDFVQTQTGVLTLDVSGYQPGQYGKLAITGTATLGGTLNTNWTGLEDPQAGETIDILTYSARIGDFDSFFLNLGAPYYFEAQPGNNAYTLITRSGT